MADELPVIVPVEVDALVVNQRVRADVVFQRWLPDFHLIDLHLDPQPEAFGDVDTTFGADEKNEGVYLRWHLPEALTRAAQNVETGHLQPPLAPNRWLVARYLGAPGSDLGQQPTAWLLESDHLDRLTGGVPYLKPAQLDARPTRIGRIHLLTDDGWTEPKERPRPFLTAFGPGMPDFSAFQPYHHGVFSLHDPLEGVAEGELYYAVAGWYADPDLADPLGTARDPLATLRDFGWDLGLTDRQLADRLRERRPRVYCAGTALKVSWQRGGRAPDSDRPKGADVTVAVGATGVDALTALATGSPTRLPLSAEQLTALQHGLNDRLAGEPDAFYAYQQYVHQAGFVRSPGGHRWTVEFRPPRTSGSSGPSGPPADPPWLTALNAAQEAYESADTRLTELREHLYALWWLRELPQLPAGYTRETFDQPIADALAAVRLAVAVRDRLRQDVPWSPRADGWDTATTEWLATPDPPKPLAPGQLLVRVPHLPFQRPTDPVVVLAGAHSGRPLTRPSIRCRFREELARPATPPQPEVVTGLPDPVAGLLGELACLTGATIESQGVTPLFGAAPWRQPWSPLYLLWEVEYFPVPFTEGTWRFDGSDHVCDTLPSTQPAPVTFRGRQFVTPHLTHNLRQQIAQYVREHPELTRNTDTAKKAVKQLGDLYDAVRALDPLSQSLTGLGERIAQRVQPTGARPEGAIGDALAGRPRYGPDPGRPKEPFRDWPDSLFQQVRAGQFRITRLMVVDAFGQAVDVVDNTNQRTFTLHPAPDLTPKASMDSLPDSRFMELKPRLCQPSRLRLALQDAGAREPGPVAGWLTHNLVDAALMAYTPDGVGVCELRVAADESAGRAVVVEPLPGATLPQGGGLPPDLRDSSPKLYAFLNSLLGAPARFRALLATMDGALPTIGRAAEAATPHASLVGRPLALVTAQAAMELDGQPVTDPSWQYVFDQQAADRQRRAFLDRRWPVRLGEANRVGDALVGYYVEDDWTALYAPRPPADLRGYVHSAAPGGATVDLAMDSRATRLTLLLDPYAPVHAACGILPVQALALPADIIQGPLSRLRAAFRAGPLLTTSRDGALLLAGPPTSTGGWQWAQPRWEPGATTGTWEYLRLAPPDQTARLDQRPVVRQGMLRLTDQPAST
ncbi:hypothetical protein [Streptomyces hainanensis]|uniref:Uncharacterized protein n=1 Tax=Streptomyces hainanensis TaxID=402648 RepID=A0A4V2Y3Z7_9ACTN|nr:hypothetical protein [Streptomyces hainanensis]TDC78375.1 hypothetical protein E1283_05245 [Streptomyces hainanensis]